jgi:hypothetical protein
VRLAFRAAAASLALAACSCVALGWQDAVAEKVATDRARLRAYDGVVLERGLVPGDASALVKRRVRFRAPSDFLLEVLEPEAYRGDVVARIGSRLQVYSRRLDAGVRLRNVPATSAEQARAAVEATTRWNLARYGYREGDRDGVAGRTATTWTATPREPTGFGGVSRWWMDAEFSVPLRATIERERDGTGAAELYSMRFESVRFFEPADDDRRLAWEAPESAGWLDWDLAGAALSADEARAAADFPLLEPASEIEGLALTKVLRASPKLVPVLALVFEHGPFYASVSEQKDRGLTPAPALGVTVDLEGGVTGRIAFAGDACSLDFVRDGVQVTVLSNMPPSLVVRFARALRAKKP